MPNSSERTTKHDFMTIKINGLRSFGNGSLETEFLSLKHFEKSFPVCLPFWAWGQAALDLGQIIKKAETRLGQ
jgi:hypothetical protein